SVVKGAAAAITSTITDINSNVPGATTTSTVDTSEGISLTVTGQWSAVVNSTSGVLGCIVEILR
ncbi:hypothetical protein EBU94_02880, partial [bacterium]|nr:hypothetical protein [bacterium]